MTPSADGAFNLVAGHHVVERVIERPQIGIDLFLHVAGQEAEPFAGLHCRARQDDALDQAALQKHGGMGDRQVGLAGSGRADAEHQFRPLQRPHIGVLIGGAGMNGALAGRNLRCGHLALLFHGRQGQLVVGGNGHAHRAIDIGLGDMAGFLQEAIKIVQRPPSLVGGNRFAANGQFIAL